MTWRRFSARSRGTILLMTLGFFGFVGMVSLFGLHMLAVTTSSNAKLTQTAQAAAYAAASAVVTNTSASGAVYIVPEDAERRAQAVVRQNLSGQFGLRSDNVSTQVTVHNIGQSPDQSLGLINPTTCQNIPGIADGLGPLAWRDHLGECHLTSGVEVVIRTTLRPCIFSGFAQKSCPPVELVTRGFADYAFRGGQRVSG